MHTILSRFCRRPKIGLALSGGGARGLAHIGVLKVLESEGVPIDYLAGTSMGGFIAAGYAAGFTAAQLEAEALRMSSLRNLVTLMDRSLPRLGLFAGRKIQEYLYHRIGDRDFSELGIPLALVAVDLETGEEVILREGRLIDAVRATISYPGIFEPCEINGRLLVDGGLLNNLPVDVARRMGADIVVAVDVSAGMDDLTSWWEAMRGNRLLPQIRLMLEVMSRCVGIMLTHIRRRKLEEARPDIIIQPELDRNISLFNGFTRAAECIAAGERAAREALPAIQAQVRRRIWFR